MAMKPSERLRPLATTVGVLALLVSLLVLAPRAEAFIYWTGGDAIGRANLDGTGVNQSFISALGADLAVNADHVYWTGCEVACAREAIGRANLDGSDANHSLISDTGHRSTGIAVDANHVYWTAADPPVVARADLDGTNVDRSFITMSDYRGYYERSGVAVDAHHVYWTQVEEPNGVSAIGRANLDGTNVERSFIPDPFGATDVAVDAEHIYWTRPGVYADAIGRANLDGTNVEPSFITVAGGTTASDPSVTRVTGVAVDANHVYWGQTIVVGAHLTFSGSIGRANLDGTSVNPDFLGPYAGSVASGLAVDDLTDTGLAGKASAKRTQKQRGKRIRIKVKIKAEERLTARATGKIKVNPTYTLKPQTAKLDARETKTLRLKPKRAKAKKIAKALKRGEKAEARLTVKLTDVAGNGETEKLSVRLKR